jgi:hypothetical protein
MLCFEHKQDIDQHGYDMLAIYKEKRNVRDMVAQVVRDTTKICWRLR